MQRLYNEREFLDEVIHCSKCGWEGSGYDVNIIDFYGLAKVKEVHCPRCDSFLGGIEKAAGQRPRRTERYPGTDPLTNQFG